MSIAFGMVRDTKNYLEIVMKKRNLACIVLLTIIASAMTSTSDAQVCTVYRPVVAAPTVTYYQPAVAPVTTMYAPAYAAPIPVVANYAPATQVVANYAPVTTYYAPAPAATTVLSPVAYTGEVWEYDPSRILRRRRWRRVYP